MREFRRCVLISFIWEKLLSTGAVEMAMSNQLRLSFVSLGTLNQHFICDELFKLQCNAVFGFLS